MFIGRQSLTRLSTFIAQLQLFQIQLTKTYGNNEFKDDIKKLLLRAGLHKIESVFLFSDTQVITIFIFLIRYLSRQFNFNYTTYNVFVCVFFIIYRLNQNHLWKT